MHTYLRFAAAALIAVVAAVTITGCAGMQVTRLVSLEEAKETELNGLQAMPAVTKSQMCTAFRSGSLNTELLAEDSYQGLAKQTIGTDLQLAFTEAEYEVMMVETLDELCP